MRHLISLGLLFCMSCNLSDPEIASAPFDQIEVPEYEEHGDAFNSVTVFLWKEHIPRTQTIAQVLTLASRYQKLNEKAAPIRKKKEALEADPEYKALLDEQEHAKGQIIVVDKTISSFRSQLAKVEAQILAKLQELDQEHQKETPDRDKIRELREQAKKLREDAARKLVQIKASEAKKSQHEAKIKEIGPKLTSHLQQIAATAASSAPLDTEQGDVVKRLEELTEWPKSQPTALKLTKSEFGLAPGVEISGWSFAGEGEARTFTSLGENPTIRDVSYAKRGGILSFSVCVYEDAEQKKISAAYRFRMVRKKTDNAELFVYSGDIWRNRPVDLVGGDDVEHPGDGQQDEDLPGEGDGRRAPPEEDDGDFEEEIVTPEYDCVDLSLMRLPGKTRSGIAKMSSAKD